MTRDAATTAAGLIVLTGVGFLAGLVELMLVPYRVGDVLIPVSVVLATLGNVLLLRTALVFAARPAAMMAPFAGWLVPTLGLSLVTRPEGDVLIPAGGYTPWVFYGMLLGGAAAGTVTMVLSAPRPTR